MKVYVAGASGEMERAAEAMATLVKIPGVELAHNWVQQILDVGAANPRDAAEAQRRAWSMDVMERVRGAAVLWLLLPTVPTIGAWCELSAAVAFDMAQSGPQKLVVTSGQEDVRLSTIFTALAREHFDTDAEALTRIRMFAR